MKSGFLTLIGLSASTLLSATQLAGACNVWHTECDYTCVETYPSGIGCKKMQKSCHRVCDDFTVNKSSSKAPALSLFAQTASLTAPSSAIEDCTEEMRLAGCFCVQPKNCPCHWPPRKTL
jgi:hypothetical protein